MGVNEMQDVTLIDSSECVLSVVRRASLFIGIPAIQHIDNGPGYADATLAKSWLDSKKAESKLFERVAVR